jgi:hypothetical protein
MDRTENRVVGSFELFDLFNPRGEAVVVEETQDFTFFSSMGSSSEDCLPGVRGFRLASTGEPVICEGEGKYRVVTTNTVLISDDPNSV